MPQNSHRDVVVVIDDDEEADTGSAGRGTLAPRRRRSSNDDDDDDDETRRTAAATILRPNNHSISSTTNGTDDDDDGGPIRMTASTSTATAGATTTTTTNHSNSNSNNNWAVQEGMRRVRSDAVERKMRWLTAVAAIGGFLFGYDTGVISGAMLPLQRQFHLTPTMQERVVSSTVLAAFVTSLVSGQFSNGSGGSSGFLCRAGGSNNGNGGRRYFLRMAALIFAAGSMVLLIAWNYSSLLVGRIVVGMAIGLCSVNSPLYIAELSTPTVRGKLVTVNALLVTIGQFVAGVVDGILDALFPHQGWRLMLGLAALPALVMYLGLSALPESPRYLALQGQIDDARRVLMAYRESDDVANQELAEILESVQQETCCMSPRRHNDNSMSPLHPSTVNDHQHHHHGGLELSAPTPSSTCAFACDTDDDHEGAAPPSSSASCAVEYGSTLSTTATTTTAIAASTTATTAAHDDNVVHPQHRRNAFEPIRSMLSDPPTRHALAVGCGLMAIQQCSGINTVMYYAASIYEMAEFGELTSVWLSAMTTLAQVVGIAISIVLVEHVGRRKLVLWSLGAVAISLVGLGMTFYLARVQSSPVTKALGMCQRQDAVVWSGITTYCYDCATIAGCGYCGGMCIPGTASGPNDLDLCPAADLGTYRDNIPSPARIAPWIYQSCHNSYGYLSVLFMVMYLLAFGIGMGGMPWTINSEIYPLRHRSLAISCSTATNWVGNLAVASTFLTLSRPSGLTTYGAFWLYSFVAAIGWMWLYVQLPETKGLSLEEIERLFRMRGAAAAAAGYDRILDGDDDDDDEDDEEEDDDEDAESDLGKDTDAKDSVTVPSNVDDSELLVV